MLSNQPEFKIVRSLNGFLIYLFNQPEELLDVAFVGDNKKDFIRKIKDSGSTFLLQDTEKSILFICTDSDKKEQAEYLRKKGAEIFKSYLKPSKEEQTTIINLSSNSDAAFHFAEGIALTGYQFLKYKSDAQKLKNKLKVIAFDKNSISAKKIKRLQTVTEAVCIARNLVNEHPAYLTAEKLSEEIKQLGKETGFSVKVFGKAKIEQLGMGGLLGVNKGSILPPTFNVLEYRPSNPHNKTPIVLVGKGIVYDTGGLSLKPTANSMDAMKCDMGGGALVTAVMYAATVLKLPIHLVALIPATDNRPGVNAYAPGDVLKMYSGATVEVLNTDAEGRLVLADALHYAKKYRPELVLDFATLTGAASRAVGDAGIVFMGNVEENLKNKFRESGERQYERLVELPLWEEYGDMLKSDIADLKNIGGVYAGAITAGKFLEHFTDYPWLHFDIAGVTYHTSGKDYRPTGGTGYGIRMVLDYLFRYSGIDKE